MRTGLRLPDRSPHRRLLVGVLGMLAFFYGVPVSTEISTERIAFSVLLTVLGVLVLAWAIVAQLRRQLHSRSEDVHTLVMLLPLVVVVFAFGFYVLETHSPGQVSGLSTRTDALYFTMSSLTTAGYGDVHAEGQLARALVTLQLVFNAVFVGALASTVVSIIRSRAPQVTGGRTP
jgi:voltage-gated potassium channel